MKTSDFGLEPGAIRAFLAVTCSLCEELTVLPGSNVIKAGAFARAQGWRMDRTSGGWICASCDAAMGDFIDSLRLRRNEARDSLAAWRERVRVSNETAPVAVR